MNLQDAAIQTRYDIMAGNAVIWESDPGVGKTDVANNDVAVEYKNSYQAVNPGASVGISTFFMATQSSIGFTGLPWKGMLKVVYKGQEYEYTITDPAIPQWYVATDMDTGEKRPANLFDTVVLIIEEWGQGVIETKRAGSEVLLHGGTPPFYLPPGSPRIALTNSAARDGVTKELDMNINRRALKRISGSVDVWDDNFASKPYSWGGRKWSVTDFTRAWAKNNPTIMFEPKPEKQGEWCTARSLTAVDRFIQVATRENAGLAPIDNGAFQESIRGHIGKAAEKYINDYHSMIKLPQYEQVVADPTGTDVPELIDLKMMQAYQLAGRVKAQDLAPIMEYVGRLSQKAKDMQITFVSAMLRRDYTLLGEAPMQAWLTKNQGLVSLIASLAR